MMKKIMVFILTAMMVAASAVPVISYGTQEQADVFKGVLRDWDELGESIFAVAFRDVCGDETSEMIAVWGDVVYGVTVYSYNNGELTSVLDYEWGDYNQHGDYGDPTVGWLEIRSGMDAIAISTGAAHEGYSEVHTLYRFNGTEFEQTEEMMVIGTPDGEDRNGDMSFLEEYFYGKDISKDEYWEKPTISKTQYDSYYAHVTALGKPFVRVEREGDDFTTPIGMDYSEALQYIQKNIEASNKKKSIETSNTKQEPLSIAQTVQMIIRTLIDSVI